VLCANITTIYVSKMDKCLRPKVFSAEADTARMALRGDSTGSVCWKTTRAELIISPHKIN